jgi:hypothetical protein
MSTFSKKKKKKKKKKNWKDLGVGQNLTEFAKILILESLKNIISFYNFMIFIFLI